MPSSYNGRGGNLGVPTPIGIASSTNTSDVEVTAATPHGLVTGDTIFVHDHEVNVGINGFWFVTVVDTTKFTIDGSTGVGVGGATGGFYKLVTSPSTFAIPSDGEARDAASVNVALEHLADRTALLEGLLFLSPYFLGQGLPRIVELATNNDSVFGSNGSGAPSASTVELSNSRFTLDKLSVNQRVLVIYQANADTSGAAGGIGIGYKAYAPGASSSGFTRFDGAQKKVANGVITPVTMLGFLSYPLAGGNLDICLTGFATGSETVTFYGDYSLVAVVF